MVGHILPATQSSWCFILEKVLYKHRLYLVRYFSSTNECHLCTMRSWNHLLLQSEKLTACLQQAYLKQFIRQSRVISLCSCKIVACQMIQLSLKDFEGRHPLTAQYLYKILTRRLSDSSLNVLTNTWIFHISQEILCHFVSLCHRTRRLLKWQTAF